MRGKRAKMLARSALLLNDRPLSYKEANKKNYSIPVFEPNEKGEQVVVRNIEFSTHTRVLGDCTRRTYQMVKQIWKSQHSL